jgi:hypothetical protein
MRNPIRALIAPTPTWSWGRLRVTPRQIVLMLQVGLAVTVALAAGLFVRSFANVAAVDVGFDDPKSVLIMRVVPRGLGGDAGTAFYEALLSRVRSAPEVVSAAVALDPPFLSLGLRIARPGAEPGVAATTTSGGARLFTTLGTPIVAGREFLDTDRVAEDGLVINRELAAMLWPGQNPVGEPVIWGPTRVPTTIVGVVDMPRCQNIGADPGPCGWRPFQLRNVPGYLHVRTLGEPLAFVSTLRAIARDLNPDVALANEVSLDTLLQQLVGRQRLAALASAGLAVFGILLVTVGCVSLFCSMVRESLREIAIRMALGASRRALIERMILHACPLIAIGLVLGTITAYAIGQRLSGELYGVNAADPLTLVAAPTAIALIALGSVLYAALMAARTEPARYLKAE